MKLIEQQAKPINKGSVPLSKKEIDGLMRQIPHWSLGEKTLGCEFRFKDFQQAMDFANSVAAIANRENHHPDLFISYSRVQITLSTHAVDGLTLNDFIVAAKIDALRTDMFGKKAA